jgi:hypothetical protein
VCRINRTTMIASRLEAAAIFTEIPRWRVMSTRVNCAETTVMRYWFDNWYMISGNTCSIFEDIARRRLSWKIRGKGDIRRNPRRDKRVNDNPGHPVTTNTSDERDRSHRKRQARVILVILPCECNVPFRGGFYVWRTRKDVSASGSGSCIDPRTHSDTSARVSPANRGKVKVHRLKRICGSRRFRADV